MTRKRYQKKIHGLFAKMAKEQGLHIRDAYRDTHPNFGGTVPFMGVKLASYAQSYQIVEDCILGKVRVETN